VRRYEDTNFDKVNNESNDHQSFIKSLINKYKEQKNEETSQFSSKIALTANKQNTKVLTNNNINQMANKIDAIQPSDSEILAASTLASMNEPQSQKDEHNSISQIETTKTVPIIENNQFSPIKKQTSIIKSYPPTNTPHNIIRYSTSPTSSPIQSQSASPSTLVSPSLSSNTQTTPQQQQQHKVIPKTIHTNRTTPLSPTTPNTNNTSTSSIIKLTTSSPSMIKLTQLPPSTSPPQILQQINKNQQLKNILRPTHQNIASTNQKLIITVPSNQTKKTNSNTQNYSTISLSSSSNLTVNNFCCLYYLNSPL
jgi:hypothetical protein